jgi:uncharacterized protein (DUF362 family)
MVTLDPKDRATPAHAFESLGYGVLKKRYGVKYLNVFERPFEKLDLGDGVKLAFNADILSSDFVVDLPVMKAHNQTMVSLPGKGNHLMMLRCSQENPCALQRARKKRFYSGNACSRRIKTTPI